MEKDEYLIGSCKYKKEPVGVDELNLLKEYAEVFGKGRKYHFYIFSKGGFTSGLKELEKNGEVTLLTLEDIYIMPDKICNIREKDGFRSSRFPSFFS